MFGKRFWNNVVIEATKWSHNQLNVNKRLNKTGFDGKPLTEENWTQSWIKTLRDKLTVTKNLESVFIDSHYALKYAKEKEAFEKNTNKLLGIINDYPKFKTKDIEAVLPELEEKRRQLEAIKANNSRIKDDLMNAKDNITNLNTEIQEQRSELQRLKEEPEGYSTASFAGIAVGMLLMGFIIGIIVHSRILNSSNNRVANEENGNESVYNSRSSLRDDVEANNGDRDQHSQSDRRNDDSD